MENFKVMKRETMIELGVFAGLVALGVVTRLISAEFTELSNFTATGAAALFAGYYFRNRWVATLVPLALMVISNLALRQYDSFGQMAIVYAALALPVVLGHSLRGRENGWRIGGYAFSTSIWFFFITNFTYWAWNNLYAKNTAGLIESYAMGLPFLRNMVASDLLFSFLLFGAFAFAVQVGMLPRRLATTSVAANT
ncbi:MAG: hypothetical protein IT427_20450 [Pirellulales bacterium]|nr:hypothetical protein [Pirellulales bacterium]